MLKYDIDKFIPHRDRIKLIKDVIEVNDNMAITSSIVSKEWPLYNNGSVNPIVLIEVVAQTTSFFEGWKSRDVIENPGMGWLVGIKSAIFHVGSILLNSKLITTVRAEYSHANIYLVSSGTVNIESDIIGEVVIQAIRPGEVK